MRKINKVSGVKLCVYKFRKTEKSVNGRFGKTEKPFLNREKRAVNGFPLTARETLVSASDDDDKEGFPPIRDGMSGARRLE
jgi:hypothetical protein